MTTGVSFDDGKNTILLQLYNESCIIFNSIFIYQQYNFDHKSYILHFNSI